MYEFDGVPTVVVPGKPEFPKPIYIPIQPISL